MNRTRSILALFIAVSFLASPSLAAKKKKGGAGKPPEASEKVVAVKDKDGNDAGTVSVVKDKEWSGDGKTFTIFNLTVKNSSGKKGKFFGEIKLDGGASGSCTYFLEVGPGEAGKNAKDCKQSASWASFEADGKVEFGGD
jgi:hypothetical protein